MAQAQNCFDPNRDCTSVGEVLVMQTVRGNLGDTVRLRPTTELCNTWTVPTGVTFFAGAGSDSTAVFVIIDQCQYEPIFVDGRTESPGGGGTASCLTTFVYDVGQHPDTTYQSLTTCLPDQTGTNTATLASANGCDSVVITTTTLGEPPVAQLSDVQVCTGEAAILDALAPNIAHYRWSTGDTTALITTTVPGLYSVTLTDFDGCQAVASASVSVGNINIGLTATVVDELLVAEQPLTVWAGAAVQYEAHITGATPPYDIIWNGGPAPGDTILNQVARESAEVTVAVISPTGCVGQAALVVAVEPLGLFVPNAFSPNGDGSNDQWDVFTSPNVEAVRLQVFSRMGNMVFEDLEVVPEPISGGLVWRGWDGRFRNERLNPQALIYQVQYKAYRGEWAVQAGALNLVR